MDVKQSYTNMSHKWLEVGFRVPVLFALDYCMNFFHVGVELPLFLNYLLQIVAIFSVVCVLVSSTNQLFSVYHFGMFLFHLISILHLNITSPTNLNEFLMYNDAEDYPLTLTSFALSWVVYVMFNVLYALSFQSVKPLITAFAIVPIVQAQIFSPHEPKPLLTCLAFGVQTFVVLQTLYNFTLNFFALACYQVQVLTVRFRIYGAFVLFMLHWRQLHMHAVFCLYWFILWNYQLIVFTIFIDDPFHYSFLLACLSHTCNSFVKVLAFCHVLQHIVKVFLRAINNFVRDDHTFIDENLHHPTGLREGMGFLFLSLYTDLTSVDPSKRIMLMELIVLIILSVLLRSIFGIIEPYLLSLNGVTVHSRQRHIGLIASCCMLICCAFYLGHQLYNLRERVPFSIPNIITVVQIVSALVLYFLYMYNSYNSVIWEELDDYVYYVKGTCRSFEFLLIILILVYRVFDTTSKWTIFQIITVLLHLYVNVYLSLKDGWHSLQMRRIVNNKLKVLPEASATRLSEDKDVCPICLDEMKSARITPCNHLFHLFCLKKWLKVQNKCPMCHANIFG